MSEKHPQHESIDLAHEKLDELVGEHEQKQSHEQQQKAHHEHAEKLDKIRQEAAEKAEESEDVIAKQTKEDKAPASTFVRSDLKEVKYERTLKSVQKDLSKPERVLSKVVHNSVVDAVSNVGEKTVARPYGLLVGGIFAFLGSSTFLWISKHYGYEYNFLLFVLFFGGGFALGLLIELAYRLAKKAAR